MAKIVVFNGRIKSGSTNIPFIEFNATPKVEKKETSDSEGSGFGSYAGGMADCDIDFTFHYDDAAAVLATFVPGGVTPIEIDTTKLGTKKFTGNMYVEQAPFKGRLRDLLTVQVVGCTSGPYTYPT